MISRLFHPALLNFHGFYMVFTMVYPEKIHDFSLGETRPAPTWTWRPRSAQQRMQRSDMACVVWRVNREITGKNQEKSMGRVIVTNWLFFLEPFFLHILGISSSQVTFIFFRWVETTNQLRMVVVHSGS